ncbi:MAG TPA: protein-glutamate O-methyltransferase CheR [bacterium]|nr:protein-glutamate O-methyltransferase CheR [Myxococcales bacterium]OQA59035.1 MAG: Chemotaxis protein methyltransferase [bacterium ADurb.Bin270]HPW45707.1 protein-glutamate O-methyltransferase CheR [bacterium]HQH80421.1 protein-glutamate O-methyltransferase CheR [bacterium]
MVKQNLKVIDSIIQKIKSERRLDFSQYRKPLLARRIATRALLAKRPNLEEYLELLESDPAEMDFLVDKITINVTELFRDPKVFDSLRTKVIPEILNLKKYSSGGEIRIWSSACATGREAYSVLILLLEILGSSYDPDRIKLLGTDIDENSIEDARTFSIADSEIVSLREDFRALCRKNLEPKEGEGWSLPEKLRKSVNFVRHDLTKELRAEIFDLILCRNVFIYFERNLQLLVMRRIFEKLYDNGYLVMGLVESVPDEMRGLFDLSDANLRIFRKGKSG